VRPGRAADHSPTSSAEVLERVELYLYPPSGPHRACNGNTLPFTAVTTPLRTEREVTGTASSFPFSGVRSNRVMIIINCPPFYVQVVR